MIIRILMYVSYIVWYCGVVSGEVRRVLGGATDGDTLTTAATTTTTTTTTDGHQHKSNDSILKDSILANELRY